MVLLVMKSSTTIITAYFDIGRGDWTANKGFREKLARSVDVYFREGANKRGNSSRLTQSFHFFMFEPIFSPVNALNQPI
ncbi:WlaTC/HtrL family glycosyltransferase [Escherichia coli]|uniref:WlaTC/HtrL family glycosyltransferase n=1 Tax=Escherichia coli TaxID=562 RepID=UPI0038602554